MIDFVFTSRPLDDAVFAVHLAPQLGWYVPNGRAVAPLTYLLSGYVWEDRTRCARGVRQRVMHSASAVFGARPERPIGCCALRYGRGLTVRDRCRAGRERGDWARGGSR